MKDKAISLINLLSSARVEDEEKFNELVISMCAIDKLLESDGTILNKFAHSNINLSTNRKLCYRDG